MICRDSHLLLSLFPDIISTVTLYKLNAFLASQPFSPYKKCFMSRSEHAAGVGQHPDDMLAAAVNFCLLLPRLSHDIESMKRKNWLQKILIHTQALAAYKPRNNLQKRRSCTCARGQGHPSNESAKSLRACGCLLLPSPLILPGESTDLPSHQMVSTTS